MFVMDTASAYLRNLSDRHARRASRLLDLALRTGSPRALDAAERLAVAAEAAARLARVERGVAS